MLIDIKDFEMELSLYMNRLHDDCGGCCSVGSEEKVLSQTDVLNILKQTKEYTKDHTKNHFHDGSVLIDKETIDKMYDRYIGRCAALANELPASYNEGFVSGQKSEDEQWLKLFGVDLSYEKVHRDTCKAVCSDHMNEVLEEIVSESDDPIEKEAAAEELEKRGVRKSEEYYGGA